VRGVRCCTPLLNGHDKGHLRRWKMASELVGVAGFEPTTSSSRTRSTSAWHVDVWLFQLLKVLVLVGLTRFGKGADFENVSPLSPSAWTVDIWLAPMRASRRAGFARSGRARRVQVERPAGRTTWTRRARSGCLRCAAGSPGAGIPKRPGPGRVALAAGGYSRVVGPEALPAGGRVVAAVTPRPAFSGWLATVGDSASGRKLIIRGRLRRAGCPCRGTCPAQCRVRG
jgi:hypothetical protein